MEEQDRIQIGLVGFGKVVTGRKRVVVVTVSNSALSHVILSNVSLSCNTSSKAGTPSKQMGESLSLEVENGSAIFSIDMCPNIPIDIPPEHQVFVHVGFSPFMAQTFTAKINFDMQGVEPSRQAMILEGEGVSSVSSSMESPAPSRMVAFLNNIAYSASSPSSGTPVHRVLHDISTSPIPVSLNDNSTDNSSGDHAPSKARYKASTTSPYRTPSYRSGLPRSGDAFSHHQYSSARVSSGLPVPPSSSTKRNVTWMDRADSSRGHHASFHHVDHSWAPGTGHEHNSHHHQHHHHPNNTHHHSHGGHALTTAKLPPSNSSLDRTHQEGISNNNSGIDSAKTMGEVLRTLQQLQQDIHSLDWSGTHRSTTNDNASRSQHHRRVEEPSKQEEAQPSTPARASKMERAETDSPRTPQRSGRVVKRATARSSLSKAAPDGKSADASPSRRSPQSIEAVSDSGVESPLETAISPISSTSSSASVVDRIPSSDQSASGKRMSKNDRSSKAIEDESDISDRVSKLEKNIRYLLDNVHPSDLATDLLERSFDKEDKMSRGSRKEASMFMKSGNRCYAMPSSIGVNEVGGVGLDSLKLSKKGSSKGNLFCANNHMHFDGELGVTPPTPADEEAAQDSPHSIASVGAGEELSVELDEAKTPLPPQHQQLVLHKQPDFNSPFWKVGTPLTPACPNSLSPSDLATPGASFRYPTIAEENGSPTNEHGDEGGEPARQLEWAACHEAFDSPTAIPEELSVSEL